MQLPAIPDEVIHQASMVMGDLMSSSPEHVSDDTLEKPARAAFTSLDLTDYVLVPMPKVST